VSTEPARPRKPRFQAQVRRVQRLAPRMVRVTFGGDELAHFVWNGPAAHIKVFLSMGDSSAPEGSAAARPLARTYTPRRFDAQAGELDVDFVIHGEGPASSWAAQARPGQSLTIAGPGRSYAVDAQAPWHLLVGDDSAIPAIGTILEALPGARVRSLIEVVDDAERTALATSAGAAHIEWLTRGTDPRRAGTELEAALRAMELPPGAGRVYVACEADAMRRMRRHLIFERGLERAQLVTRGYWRLGETDHPDRDYGEDVG